MATTFTFVGSYEFSWIVLEQILKRNHQLEQIITRRSPIKNEVYEFERNFRKDNRCKKSTVFSVNSQEELAQLKTIHTDYLITAGYNFKLPTELLCLSKKGSVNIHPSLLPKWKGPDPIRNMILNEDPLMGVSIHLMTDIYDSGKIISQAILPNDNTTNFSNYIKILGKIGGSICASLMDENTDFNNVPPIHPIYHESYGRKVDFVEYAEKNNDSFKLNLLRRAFS